jgi:hypothetical protein
MAMEGTILLILVLTLGPMVLQIMAINIFWQRMTAALQRADDHPPFDTCIIINDIGPDRRGVVRLLERRTRLDLSEIDALAARGHGRLPLPMSRAAAWRLMHALRQLDAHVELEPRQAMAA